MYGLIDIIAGANENLDLLQKEGKRRNERKEEKKRKRRKARKDSKYS